MNASTDHGLRLRTSRATTAILHRVDASRVEAFLEWQRGIAEAMSRFPGYQEAEIYPPAPATEAPWVVLVHFDDAASLAAWVESPERAAWTSRLPPSLPSFQMRALKGGLGAWFAEERGADAPGWKMALAVLVALYPIVAALALVVGPWTARWGFALSLFAGNVLSVALMQWAVMPLNLRAWAGWLAVRRARTPREEARGLVAMLAVLAAELLVFRALAG